MLLSRKQVGVALGMLSGFGFSALVLGLGVYAHPLSSSFVPDFAARLRFTLCADLFVFLWLLAAIANIARARFFSPADIDGSGLTRASADMASRVAILQNTLEQVVLAFGAHLGLAAATPHALIWIVPLVVLFGIGRAAFWIGYRYGAAGRAFGFATTFYPTVFAYGLALVAVIGHSG